MEYILNFSVPFNSSFLPFSLIIADYQWFAVFLIEKLWAILCGQQWHWNWLSGSTGVQPCSPVSSGVERCRAVPPMFFSSGDL